MGKLMEILISILAIIGLVRVANRMFGGEEGCYLCRVSNINKKDIKQAREKTTQQVKENVTKAKENVSQKVKNEVKQAEEKTAQRIKENVAQTRESMSQKIKKEIKQAADNVSQKMSVDNKKQGTRYGSNPIRY